MMNPSPTNQPVKTATATPLRSGQIPTMHDLLDWEQVNSLAEDLDTALAELEDRFADYVTNVSLKKKKRR